MSLDGRARDILQVIVEAYIDEAQAVSSAAVARRGRALRLSPATIRSVMAELEELGLLTQPHTSAGRIPTELGLRTYLDGLMSPKLHPWDRSRLDATLQGGDLAEFPSSLGQSLAGLSGQVAVVAVPRFLGTRFREVGLVRCATGRFLALFVSPGGLVQHKLVEVDFDLKETEITWVQNFLNERLRALTLAEARALVQQELGRAEALRDTLTRQAFAICEQALPSSELRLLVQGAARLVEQPEFADVEKLRSVLRAIDDHAALLELLDRVLDGDGVQVVLGSEHQLGEATALACVGSRWQSGNGDSGAVSLIGPQRMDYGRLVPMVRYAMQLFEGYCERL